MIIKIISIPEGPAPIEVRKQWLGVEMPAEKMSEKSLEIDFLKTQKVGVKKEFFTSRQEAEVFLDAFVPGANLGNRGGFSVKFEDAINALREKSNAAAEWFENNMSNPTGLAFGPNEAIIIHA